MPLYYGWPDSIEGRSHCKHVIFSMCPGTSKARRKRRWSTLWGIGVAAAAGRDQKSSQPVGYPERCRKMGHGNPIGVAAPHS